MPHPLLPNEPRLIDPAAAQALTDAHLRPHLKALEVFLLELRGRVDVELKAAAPVKYGKAYPLSQCLEISSAVYDKVRSTDAAVLSPLARQGQRALLDFFAVGGAMRMVWGDLRGRYFQNAFAVGDLYVDVANDTVVATKPKVEILPFDQCGLTPIRDYAHFARIAQRYWEVYTWPNHIVPSLAPYFPMLIVSAKGRMQLVDRSAYLQMLNITQAFNPAETFLMADLMPQYVFDEAATRLRSAGLELASNPAQGRERALQQVRLYRDNSWHSNPHAHQRILEQHTQADRALGQASAVTSSQGMLHFARTQRSMNILFIHQNFPGQFKHLAPALVKQGHQVTAMTMQKVDSAGGAPQWQGVRLVPYSAARGTTPGVHPWVSDFETKTIRGEACFRAALKLKAEGYTPDVIIAHHGWGESLFLKDVWPQVRLGIYCEFFYQSQGADTGFDPEFPVTDAGDACRLRLKNLNNLLHFEVADAAISPTQWQASTFPQAFRSKITVVHDGIDTTAVAPNPQVQLKLARPDGGQLALSRQDEIITFVNRNLEPYRGYHTFMRALPQILRERPRARVLIVGGDDVSYGARPTPEKNGGSKWKDIFIAEVRPQISDADWQRVHFLGHVPYQYFVPLLQLSTVHVYLTYPFVLSWSLLEAMSAGCAIVASDTQPLHEAITHDDTGRLVNFFDAPALAREVCALLDDPLARQRLGENARLFARQNYDLNSVCLPRQLQWVEGLARQ